MNIVLVYLSLVPFKHGILSFTQTCFLESKTAPIIIPKLSLSIIINNISPKHSFIHVSRADLHCYFHPLQTQTAGSKMLKAILSYFSSSLGLMCSPNAPHKKAEAIGIIQSSKKTLQQLPNKADTKPKRFKRKRKVCESDSSQAYHHPELLSIVLKEDESLRRRPAAQ